MEDLDWIKAAVKTEVFSSFDKAELKAFPSFKEFWNEVEVMNAHEEEWQNWKDKGVKTIYEQVFNQARTNEN